MPEVAATCVDSSTASAISCVVVSPYAPLYAFKLELELDPEGAPGVWTEYIHFDTHTFGPFELDAEFAGVVNFRLTNIGTQPINLQYTFGDTDLFGYGDPSAAEVITLGVEAGVDDIFEGSFEYNKSLVDQEILPLSFVSQEGPQIVVSLRNCVTVVPEPPGLTWLFDTNESGQYSFYCLNEEEERVLIGTLLVEDASEVFDITDIMNSDEIIALPGVERTLFVLRDDSNTGGPYETATNLNYDADQGEGTFSQQGFTPPLGDYGPVVPSNSVTGLIIENYQTSSCTVLCAVAT